MLDEKSYWRFATDRASVTEPPSFSQQLPSFLGFQESEPESDEELEERLARENDIYRRIKEVWGDDDCGIGELTEEPWPNDIDRWIESKARELAAGQTFPTRPPGVFISYAHANKEFVRELTEVMRERNLRVWIDEVELDVGDSLIKRIAEAIVEEDFVVAVVSAESAESGWCSTELDLALTEGINGRKVKVLPIRLDEAPMPPALRATVWCEAHSNSSVEPVVARLTKAIKKNMEAREEQGFEPILEEARERLRTALDKAARKASAEAERADYRRRQDARSLQLRDLDLLETAVERFASQWAAALSYGAMTSQLAAAASEVRALLEQLAEPERARLPTLTHVVNASWNGLFSNSRFGDYRARVEAELTDARTMV